VIQEALEREKNRAVRLAREAREAATGIKEPSPVQPSLVESFKKMDVQSEEGKTASRIRGLEQKVPSVPETVPVAAPVPAPVSEPTIPKGPASSKPSRFFSKAPETASKELPEDGYADFSDEELSEAVDAIIHRRLRKDATSVLNGMDEVAIAKLPPQTRHSLKVPPRVCLAQEAERKGGELEAKRATDAEAGMPAGRFNSQIIWRGTD